VTVCVLDTDVVIAALDRADDRPGWIATYDRRVRRALGSVAVELAPGLD
jgi:hypothetical protein